MNADVTLISHLFCVALMANWTDRQPAPSHYPPLATISIEQPRNTIHGKSTQSRRHASQQTSNQMCREQHADQPVHQPATYLRSGRVRAVWQGRQLGVGNDLVFVHPIPGF